MTHITLYWSPRGLLGLSSQGHSGHGKKGEDVVCAAVSSLVHALLLGLDQVLGLKDIDTQVDASVPLINIKWTEEKLAEMDVLTRTIALSLKEIAAGYPGYVCITEVHLT